MACKFIWVESRFWMKIILQVEKWATWHWLLKYDLKTNTYGIWFLYALFASNFWIFKAFTGYLWVFMILLDLFLNSCWNLLIWVFWRFSCNIWDFWIFIWAMIPNWGWNWESWHNSGQSEIWYCGQSAGKGRTVRRSLDLSTRGSAEKFSTSEIHCGQSAKRPRTVRLCWADFTRGSFSQLAV